MGRKKIEIDLAQVEKLAAIGLNEQQVADSLGISVPTLEDRKANNQDFLSALKRGKAKGIAQVANNLFEQSKNGQVSAGIFFMKNRAGWTDKIANEHTGADGGPIETVTKQLVVNGIKPDTN